MRLVLDTNVLIAAFVSRGHCYELLEHVVRSHGLFTSEFILAEFAATLTGKFRIEQRFVDAAVALQRSRMTVVEPAPLPKQASRDPDDDWVLATAVEARADCLLTGDSDLLVLGKYSGIPVLSPASFWGFEAESERSGS